MENAIAIPLYAHKKASPFVLFRKDQLPARRHLSRNGNRDNVGDRIANGAFAKTHKEGRKNIVHLGITVRVK